MTQHRRRILFIVWLCLGLASGGCDRQHEPSALASQARDLALFLKPNAEDIQSHMASQREQMRFEKGQLDFALLLNAEVSDRSWCYTVYRLGEEGPWGVVPGTARRCDLGDLEEQKARAKEIVDTWLEEELDAPAIQSDVAYLGGVDGLGRTGQLVAQAAGSTVSLRACIADAIDVQTELLRDTMALRCETLMSDEVNLDILLERQERRDLFGAEVKGSSGDGDASVTEGFEKRFKALSAEKRAAWLMLNAPKLAASCWEHVRLSDDATAHYEVTEAAMALCSEGARRAATR